MGLPVNLHLTPCGKFFMQTAVQHAKQPQPCAWPCAFLRDCRVAALAQERIYSPDQKQYWSNLVLLLFAGADACDKVLRQKVRR